MAITKSFQGTVTDANGLFATMSGTMSIVEAPAIQSIVVVPQSAPAGTLRTITINATGDSALSYALTVDGVPATPTGQPNVFTVVA